MTIKETLEAKRNGKLYYRSYMRSGMKSGNIGEYTNLYLDKTDGGVSIFGYNRKGEVKMLSKPCYIDPNQEYRSNTGIWIGGYDYLYLKK